MLLLFGNGKQQIMAAFLLLSFESEPADPFRSWATIRAVDERTDRATANNHE